jgi:hypothetical protein
MARFRGAAQGVAVWVWALVATAVVVAGDRFDVFDRIDGLPNVPISEAGLTTTGAIALVAAALVGALLGGMAGTRYHRRVDRVALNR